MSGQTYIQTYRQTDHQTGIEKPLHGRPLLGPATRIIISVNMKNVNVGIRAAALIAGVNSKATNDHVSIWELVYFAPTTNRTGISIKC